jgi:hypothetical protein
VSELEAQVEALTKERDEKTRTWHLLLQDIHVWLPVDEMEQALVDRVNAGMETGCVPDCGSCQRSLDAEAALQASEERVKVLEAVIAGAVADLGAADYADGPRRRLREALSPAQEKKQEER